MQKEHHVALYRKYRPASFDDVRGQEQIVLLLKNAISQHKVSHAYLFCGGRGTGKTTVARIVARDIGCNPEDIIEIDAASNRGIDEIRELREAVRTAPFSSPYKVYIIDEAHMLTKEAANALLKTLEEPPSHVIFILATTDPEKLPTTIVSRCQKVVFKSPDIQTLTERLFHVAHKEGYISFPMEGAELIARHSKGSYRDGLGILEQVLTASSDRLSFEDITLHLGAPQEEVIISLLDSMCRKDTKSLVDSISLLQKGNMSALRVYDSLIDIFRLALISRLGGEVPTSPVVKGLAIEHPHTVASKTILELLEKRHLLEVSEGHSWTAFTAILLSCIEV